MNQELNITSISELLQSAQGEIVSLPPFIEGHPFVARLKRPSLMMLVKSGRIPNQLITSANKLFNGKGIDDNKPEAMGKALEVFEIICEATFVEPKYRAMKEAGIELTDEQFMAVFNYTQAGVKTLMPFRGKPTDNVSSSNVTEVQGSAVSST